MGERERKKMDKKREYMKTYYERHRDSRLEYQGSYNKKNKEVIKEYQKKYHSEKSQNAPRVRCEICMKYLSFKYFPIHVKKFHQVDSAVRSDKKGQKDYTEENDKETEEKTSVADLI